jgi:Epoxide hydrolase N terminus
MSAPKPFTIDINQKKIENLKTKLSLAEFPDELGEAGWDLGCPLTDIQRLTKAWESWDWRKAEKELNQLPQFHTDINIDGFGGLDIHFVHQKSEIKGAIPLLFVHGCK